MFTRALLEQKTDGSGQLLTHIWSHANNSVGHHGVSVVLLLGEGGERLWTSRARQLGVAGKAEIAARELAKKLGVTPIPLSVEESEWNRSDDFSDPIPREIMNLSQFVVIIQRNEKDVDKVSQWVASEAAKETLSDLKRSLQDPERRKVIPINDEP